MVQDLTNSLPYKICSRCVMDTSDPAIRFNHQGECNHCTAYLARAPQLVYQGQESDRELEQLVLRIKRQHKSKSYDCVVGMSGGVDSSYVAQLAKKMGLRPLAVHMDNGWNSEEAVKNIQRVCGALKIDYESFILNWEEFRQIQLAFLKASIVEMEIPTDMAIQGALHRVAVRHGIKCILSGGNHATEGILPGSWFYDPKDYKLVRSICRRFGPKKIRHYPTFDYPREIYYKLVRGIYIYYPLNLVPYDKTEAMNRLKAEFGWIDYGGKHHESRYTKFVQNFIQPTKFGVDYRRATFSTQICMGVTTRENALGELENLPYNSGTVAQDKAYVAKKFGLTLEELENVLKQPAKSYQDYPNNEKLLKFIYATYRRLFKSTRSYAGTYDQE